MKYDRSICLKNIYKLVKLNNLKIGDVEKECGVSTGYFSKLLKEECKASPSIEVLSKLTEILKIDLVRLCSYDLDSIDENDVYLYNFLNKLLKDTKEGKFIWIKENVKELKSETLEQISGKSKIFFDQEVVNYIGKYGNEWNRYVPVFKSFFRKGELLEADDDFYILKYSDNTIFYLVSIININDGYINESEINKTYEMYVKRDNDLSAIDYCDIFDDNTNNLIFDLYFAAKDSSKHRVLSNSAKTAIDDFMRGEPIATIKEDD